MPDAPLHLVDAFTDAPFAGNPAAVCVLAADADDGWMQSVAAEMNQAETAFVRPTADPAAFGLRWFTPTTEVDLCGHATLAAAHVLGLPAVRFQTRGGLLTCSAGDDGWKRMDFPATPAEPAPIPAGLSAALGVPVDAVSRRRFDYLVELPAGDRVVLAGRAVTVLRGTIVR